MPTFYVSQTGTGNGSSPSVPMSPAAFNANTYSIAAGDTVVIIDRVTTALTAPISGTSGNLITLTGKLNGELVGSIDLYPSGGRPLFFNNTAYWVVEDLTVMGGSTSCIYITNAGSLPTSARHITIQRCTVKEAIGGTTGSIGIRWYGAYVTVQDCTIYDIDCDGIWFQGHNATIQRNNIYQVNRTGAAVGGDCIQAANYYDDCLIEGNILTNNIWDNKQAIVVAGATTTGATNVIIKDNDITVFQGASSIGSKGMKIAEAISGRCTGNRVRYGYHGILFQSDAVASIIDYTIEGNIVTDTDFAGIIAGVGGEPVKIVHNVCDNCVSGISTTSTTTDTIVNNNILINNTTGIQADPTQAGLFNGNCFYNNDTNCSQTLGSGSILADPLFLSTSDYRLQSNSPCHRAGVAINSYQTFHGFNGRAFERGNPTIGAYPQLFRDL